MSNLKHYGVLGMKWGVRKDRKKSVLIYNKAKQKEPRITTELYVSMLETTAKLKGLKNRLKTKDSISRKLENKDVADAVRYTITSPENDFVKTIKK